jgi:hypothetical protein
VLANYDTLKAAYEARASELPAEELFQNGYPSREEIISWIEQSKLELMKKGMSVPSPDKYQGKAETFAQIKPLSDLWKTAKWVSAGDSFKVPDLAKSAAVLTYFRSNP